MSTTKDNKNIYLGINSLKMAVFLLIDSVAVFLSYLFGFLVEYDSLNYKIILLNLHNFNTFDMFDIYRTVSYNRHTEGELLENIA